MDNIEILYQKKKYALDVEDYLEVRKINVIIQYINNNTLKLKNIDNFNVDKIINDLNDIIIDKMNKLQLEKKTKLFIKNLLLKNTKKEIPSKESLKKINFKFITLKYLNLLNQSKNINFNKLDKLNLYKNRYNKMLLNYNIQDIDKDILKKYLIKDYTYILKKQNNSNKLQFIKPTENIKENKEIEELKKNIDKDKILLIELTIFMINNIKTIYDNNLNYTFNSSYFGKKYSEEKKKKY